MVDIHVDTHTNLSPKWCGANSTALTVPRASSKTALSTHLDDELLPETAVCACPDPLGWTSPPAAKQVCSQILTVRSKDADARIVPNSGWAQLSLEIAASCAYAKKKTRSIHRTRCHGKERDEPSIRLLRSRSLQLRPAAKF